MNLRRVDMLLVGAALAALALIGWLTWGELEPPPRSPPAAPVASLAECQGDVRVRDPETLAWSRGPSGSALRAGDAVFAADGSSALVAFSGGERLVLGPRSLVVIAAPSEGGQATLRQGAAAAMGGGSALHVRVAGAGVVTPASGRVNIRSGANGALELFVERGSVTATAGAGGPATPVEAGRGLRVAGGVAAPLPAAATLGVPSGELLLGNPDPGDPTPLEVTWAPAAPDDLVQVSPSPDFASSSSSPPTAPGRARLLLRPGAHMLRVAGPDGVPRSVARFVVVAARSAPFPWQPAPGAQVPAGRPLPLFWNEVPGATGYRLEVAPAQGDAAARLEAAAGPVTFDAIGPGRWRWRAAARFAEGDGPWSDWVEFEAVEDISVAPQLQAPELKVRRAPGEEAR